MKSNNKDDKRNKVNSRERISEDLFFWVVFIVMAVYYGYRLFALTPWYDELYTYYCFISKGPVYAAIHWPLPNNHVGYSVLSACVDKLGNSYIGLRGISYLAALANLRLLYVISKKYFVKLVAIGTVIIYLSMNLVNQIAIQGRGYTLGITCFLCAFYCMTLICEREKAGRATYIIYMASLVLGLYTVSSHVYWVIPLCIMGGLYLLYQSIEEGKTQKVFFLVTSKGKTLIRLFAASVVSALMTIGLYATIWLAIGSNLLVKDSACEFFGLSHFQMLKRAPFKALNRGMEYMLATPYIQSEERAGFIQRLGNFVLDLSGQYFSMLRWGITALWIMGCIYFLILLFREKKDESRKEHFLYLLLIVNIIFIPLCLLVQCKRPYFRVFTYGGVLLALLIGCLLNKFISWLLEHKTEKRTFTGMKIAFVILICSFGIKCLLFSGYNEQYSLQEYQIQDAYKKGFSGESFQELAGNNVKICVTDCNQQYLLFFLYGIRCENQDAVDADVLLVDKRMTDPDFKEMIWEFYHYYNTLPWDYIDKSMEPVYSNENYVLYRSKNK